MYNQLTREKILPMKPVPVASASWNTDQNGGTFPLDGAGYGSVFEPRCTALQSVPTTSKPHPLRPSVCLYLILAIFVLDPSAVTCIYSSC